MMLARVADSLYWIGRYVERAEHMCRLSEVLLNATLDHNIAGADAARIALAAAGGLDAGQADSPYELVLDLALARDNPGSITTALSRARENARQVRDQITTETWERLNFLYLKVNAPDANRAFADGTTAFLQEIIADLHLFKGAADATMSHGDGWRFLLMGVYLERAQLIGRLLAVCFADPDRRPITDHFALTSLLRMSCALEPYLRRYTADIQPRLILDYLIFDEDFPRSLRFSTARIDEHLAGIGRQGDPGGLGAPERLAGRLRARLQYADLDTLEADGAGGLIEKVLSECAQIHTSIYETFVAYSVEMRLPA